MPISRQQCQLTMVSGRALPLATGAGFAFNCILTAFVENTVIVGFFKGEPHALLNITAGLKTVFEVLNVEGINEDAFTFECLVTFTRRTPGIDINCKNLVS